MGQNSRKVDATQMCINGWLDKQKVVHPDDKILFSLKKERNSVMCYNMDESSGHYIKQDKPTTRETNIVGLHLYKIPKVFKFIDRK